MELKIDYLKASELKPYDKNTRKHEEHDVREIAKSIEKYGFSDPIGVWGKENLIVEGHGRLLAAKLLGLEEVPVIHLDHLSDEERREYAIMHNRTAELSSWDFDVLAEEMAELNLNDFDFNIDNLVFSDADLDTVGELEEIETPEPPEEPKSRRGEIYQLGNHRLMVGDSTDAAAVAALMDGKQADLVITDPPYNVSYAEKEKSLLGVRPNKRAQEGYLTGIENDVMDENEFIEFLTKAFTNLNNYLKDGGVFYIWHAAMKAKCFMIAAENAGIEIHEHLTWVKNHFVLGRQDYQWKHEPCLYGWKEGGPHYFINSRSETTVIPDLHEIEPERMKKDELVDLIKKIMENTATTVIYENKPLKSLLHPTMKPVNLIGYQMRNSSRKGENVLDLFGGSGTTLIVAEQIKRNCFMMEYEPKYADVIIQRWEEMTGKKAVLLKKLKEE